MRDIKILNATFFLLVFFFYFTISISTLVLSSKNDETKIIDAVSFNGEPIVIFRLFYLQDAVDLFILTESNITHSGKTKKYYSIDSYSSILRPMVKSGKLLIVKIQFPDDMYNLSSSVHSPELSWKRENYQRDIVRDIGLSAMNGSKFIMIVSDGDELPKKDFVASLKYNYTSLYNPMKFGMPFFYYSFKWITKDIWTGSYAINDIRLRNTNITLTNIRQGGASPYLYKENAGWHCSFFMTKGAIINKLKSYAHTEFDNPKFTNPEHVEYCRTKGKDIFGRTNHILTPYHGEFGYPLCRECLKLPYYYLFNIPRNYTSIPRNYTSIPRKSTNIPRNYTSIPRNYTIDPRISTNIPRKSTRNYLNIFQFFTKPKS